MRPRRDLSTPPNKCKSRLINTCQGGFPTLGAYHRDTHRFSEWQIGKKSTESWEGQMSNLNPKLTNLRPPWPKGVSGNPSGRRAPLREIRVMKLVRDKSSASLRLFDPFVSENF